MLDGPLQQMESVRVGQANVAEDNLERMFAHPLDCIHAGERGFRTVAASPKKVGHGVTDVFVVIDDQQRTMMRFAHRHSLPATRAPSVA